MNLTFDHTYVARISDITPDTRWSRSSSPREFLLRVRQGDRLELDHGVVSLEYFSGAKRILRGPCVYVPTGERSGRLEGGQLTGLVVGGDFALSTPTADVIDLGTEFGVSVDPAASTDVCVFDGAVRVSSTESEGLPAGSQLLTTGMAVRVEKGLGIAPALESNEDQYVRAFPEDPSHPNEISLVDAMNGRRAGRSRLAGVITANTGRSDQQPWRRATGPGSSSSRGYQATLWHPFVDGVFIPSKSGVDNQIDSTGRAVDLPAASGWTWGQVWSRKRVEGIDADSSYGDFWGTGTLAAVMSRLDQCETGMIGVHSNVGVTFDLDAIRQYWGKSPSELRAVISNLDNSRDWEPEWSLNKRFSADFRLYVDGQLRVERLDFTRSDGELAIRVDFADDARFLTFVTTDAAQPGTPNPTAFDHVVVIDPVLFLPSQ